MSEPTAAAANIVLTNISMSATTQSPTTKTTPTLNKNEPAMESSQKNLFDFSNDQAEIMTTPITTNLNINNNNNGMVISKQDSKLSSENVKELLVDEIKEEEGGMYANYNIDFDDDFNEYYDDTVNFHQPRIHYIVEQPIDNNINLVNDSDQVIDDHHLIITDLDGPSYQHLPHQHSNDQFYFLDDVVDADEDDDDDNTDHPIQYFYEDQLDQNSITGSMLLPNSNHQQYSTTDILSDARTYGLPTYLQHQQQQIQRLLNINNQNGLNDTIPINYGNPFVYSLHTILEESENESSLQTISSVASSSPMNNNNNSDHNDNNPQIQTNMEDKHEINNYSNRAIIKDSESEHKKMKMIKRYKVQQSVNENFNNVSGNFPANHDDSFDYDYDNYLEDQYDDDEQQKQNNEQINNQLNGNHSDDYDYYDDPTMDMMTNRNITSNINNNNNIESLLSSKLERYFTSGLLEPIISVSNNNNSSSISHQNQQSQQQQQINPRLSSTITNTNTTTSKEERKSSTKVKTSLLNQNNDNNNDNDDDVNDNPVNLIEDMSKKMMPKSLNNEKPTDTNVDTFIMFNNGQKNDNTATNNDDCYYHFDEIGCLCCLLDQMIFISSSLLSSFLMFVHNVSLDKDEDDDNCKIESINNDNKKEEIIKHLNRLSHLFRIDFKRFLIQLIAQLQQQYSTESTDKVCLEQQSDYSQKNQVSYDLFDANQSIISNNTNKSSRIDAIIERLMKMITLKHQKNMENREDSNLMKKILEQNLIYFMCELIKLTNIDHLLFDHRLWTKVLLFGGNSDDNHNYSLYFNKMIQRNNPSLMMKMLISPNELSHKSVSTTSNNNNNPNNGVSKKATTIIKITADGQLFVEPTTDKTTSSLTGTSVMSDNATTVESQNIQQQKSPEYRTILHINPINNVNELETPTIDVATIDNFEVKQSANNANRLSKIFRVSNPLNRSFLAKISPQKEISASTETETITPITTTTTKKANKSSIDGELSVACWTNDVDDIANINSVPIIANNASIKSSKQRKFCSNENLLNNDDSMIKLNSNNNNRNNGTTTKSSSNHRSSFRSFSHSTLDHIYELFRNPFKSSFSRKGKSRKKSIDSISTTASSKSSSEPNLNDSSSSVGNAKLRNHTKSINKINNASISNYETTKKSQKSKSNNTSLDDFDDNYDDDYDNLHYFDNDNNHEDSRSPNNGLNNDNEYSKSTPQLHHGTNGIKIMARKPIGSAAVQKAPSLLLDHRLNTERQQQSNRSWTGSWDRKLYKNNSHNSFHHSQINLNGHNGNSHHHRYKSSQPPPIDPEEDYDYDDDDVVDDNFPPSKLNANRYAYQSSVSTSNANRLQRSLSGSGASSAFNAFPRPKSCIISPGSIVQDFNENKFISSVATNDASSSSHLQLPKRNHSMKPSPVPLLGSTASTIGNNTPYTTAFRNHFEMKDDKTTLNGGQINQILIGKINLSVYYETKLNSLTITIFRCQLNIVKKSDLYVKVNILTSNDSLRKSQNQINSATTTMKTFKKKTKIRKALKVETSQGPIHEIEYNEILRFNGKWREFDSGRLVVGLWTNDKFSKNTMLGQTVIQLNERDVMLNSIQTRIWHDLWQPAKSKSDQFFNHQQSIPIKGSLFLAIKFDEYPLDNGYEELSSINESGQLQVLIKEADELSLNPNQLNGHAYCKVTLKTDRIIGKDNNGRENESSQKTRTVKITQNPRWNETLVFRNLTKQDLSKKLLNIALMWQDRSTKTYLGCVRLVNHEDANFEERNVWKQMLERPNLWAYGRIPLRY